MDESRAYNNQWEIVRNMDKLKTDTEKAEDKQEQFKKKRIF